jgi:pilus assembly protein CpaE
MSIYLLNADFNDPQSVQIEQRIQAAIPHVITIGRLDEVLQEAAGEADRLVFLLLIAPMRDKTRMSDLTEAVMRHRDRLFVIFIGDDISASEYKALIRTGRADWVPATVELQELLDIVEGARARIRLESVSTVGSARKSTAILLLPSAGGVGNSTLAIELGVHLATAKATRERSICIIDLDFQSSHVCDYLDIEPRLQIQEVLSSPERLDAQLFDIFISRHSSGLHVLAAPRSKRDMCELDMPALDVLFEMMSTRYDLILIDLPAIWFSWTLQIIAASDAVIVTGVNTIPGLRQMADSTNAVRNAAHTAIPIAMAVNRCRRRLFGGIARQHHVDSVLGRENVYCIAENPNALESVNSGAPMMLGRSSRGVGGALVALATFCAGVRQQ